MSPWRTTSLCPAQLNFCVSKNFTKQKKRANGLKTVNSLYYLSPVSHLYNKCFGLSPFPYFKFSAKNITLLFVLLFILSGGNIAFLREEGGTRQGFPEANEMSFGGSLRSVTEGARATFSLRGFYSYALSLTRLRRELPPGGSLWIVQP